MKLQGKKTGAFADFIGYVTQASPIIDISTGEIMLTVRYIDAGVNCYKDYRTIVEFNKDWEDYKPDESLIKDEKIRKAVRAWAEITGQNKLLVIKMDGRLEISDGSPHLIYISFRADKETMSNLNDRTYYTITELCGEEKE